MKKKFLFVSFTAVILLISIAISLGTAAFGPAKAGANEQLSPKPALIKADGSWNPDFLSDALTWYSDHFFLRQELISLHNLLSAKVLNTSGSNNVILGKSGWLYYADTLEDFTFTNEMTEGELFAAANNLSLMAEYCEASGKKFLFVVAPNKNSLYPENMPQNIVPVEKKNRKVLFAELESRNVPFADLFEAFEAENEVLYFSHDSHWNSKGAALGADVINAAFSVVTEYYQDDFSESQPHDGDLYEMLYPAFRDPEDNPVYGGALAFTYTGNGKSPDSITIETAAEGSGRLLAYRDSFGNLLYPYLANSYGEAYFSRSTVYDLTIDADFVLIELVERNLDYLITYVPVMPSPLRQIGSWERLAGTVEISKTKGRAPAGCVQLNGVLDAVAESVYVVCGEETYEAFLLKNGGFAVNVPEGAEAEAVVYTIGDECYLLTVQ